MAIRMQFAAIAAPLIRVRVRAAVARVDCVNTEPGHSKGPGVSVA
jgi:hypothetical protein